MTHPAISTRLIYPPPFKHLNFDQELRVGGSDNGQTWGAAPHPRDIAAALASTNHEWFEEFMVAFADLSPNRAIAVARVAERTRGPR